MKRFLIWYKVIGIKNKGINNALTTVITVYTVNILDKISNYFRDFLGV